MSEKQENTQNEPENTENESGKKPDYIAYNVKETKQGKSMFFRVGAGWQHKDGQGYDIQLDSMPVNGRVTLREMREKEMQNYKGQEQTGGTRHNQQQEQSREQVKDNGHAR